MNPKNTDSFKNVKFCLKKNSHFTNINAYTIGDIPFNTL